MKVIYSHQHSVGAITFVWQTWNSFISFIIKGDWGRFWISWHPERTSALNTTRHIPIYAQNAQSNQKCCIYSLLQHIAAKWYLIGILCWNLDKLRLKYNYDYLLINLSWCLQIRIRGNIAKLLSIALQTKLLIFHLCAQLIKHTKTSWVVQPDQHFVYWLLKCNFGMEREGRRERERTRRCVLITFFIFHFYAWNLCSAAQCCVSDGFYHMKMYKFQQFQT